MPPSRTSYTRIGIGPMAAQIGWADSPIVRAGSRGARIARHSPAAERESHPIRSLTSGAPMVNQTGTYATTQDERGAQIIADPDDASRGPGPAIMDAKTLTGDGVVNAAGEDLGKIEAIMLDVASGRVAYAVLSFGGFLGMGSKLFAIPWGALKLDSSNSRFVFDVSKENLENAEGFDKDDWPS